jgi:hypothetical protein
MLMMMMKLPPPTERAPQLGAGKAGWPKALEPGSLCEEAGLHTGKHRSQLTGRFGQRLHPFTAGSGILLRNSEFRKLNSRPERKKPWGIKSI